jgi:pyruvate dehydrogenase E2 component (dihydrolipoamide acetyltransferase)
VTAIDAPVHELLMPRLSDTMSEGTISRWLKGTGEPVHKGEPMAEVETDKVTVQLEAPADGVVLALLVPDGGTIEVGGVVAAVGPAGAAYVPPEPAAPIASTSGDALEPAPAELQESRTGPARNGGRPKATPLARRLAAERGIDLVDLGSGSGPDGRILRQDIERALEAATAGGPRVGNSSAPSDEPLELSQLQKAVARRMTAAKHDVPHYYVDTTVDVTRLLELRSEAKNATTATDAPVTAYLIRAASLALRAFPRVNASWLDGTVVIRGAVNVGIAVALDEDGLVVPVVKDADQKQLGEVAAVAASLIARARAGKLTHDDMSDGTFTISNLGGFGIDTFHAVINPPESAILAVGAIRRIPAVVGEQVVARDVMQLSLSADHRVFSGATAAVFLADIRRRLEQPLDLLF